MALPEPSFIERNGPKILAECIAFVESKLQRPLSPSQAEHVLCTLFAYRELVLRAAIQEAAKQNLPAYARYPMIDLICAIAGVERIPPKSAGTTLRFTLPNIGPAVVPVGTRVRTKDGRVTFATTKDATILVGQTVVDVDAAAEVTGNAGNGYVAGQVTELLTSLGFSCTVTNTTTTDGGAPSETTEQLRKRLPRAVRALSVAGPEDAYAFLALSAHPSIIDVSVLNPEPRTARFHVLTEDGVPSSEVLDLVYAACSAKTVRPLTDIVDVQAAVAVTYDLRAHLTLRRGLTVAAQAAAEAAATDAANDFAKALRSGLGLRWVDSQAYKALSVDGVYRVEFEDVGPDVRNLERDSFAQANVVSVDVVGYEAGP